jgi:TetR/AcrR family transcriptional regulator, transcriptional repressor of aconitase
MSILADMKKTGVDLDRERRQQILDAALQCFLQFGYAKTSMDDVAKRAHLSRPLIYLKFKSKQDLVRGIYIHFMKSALERAESILGSTIPTKAKLAAVVEAINVRAWEKVVGQSMTKEFYPLCERQFPDESERFERQRVKIYQQLLGGDKALAETFVLAIDGFCADTPSVKTLRARIGIMIDRFLPNG